MHTKFGVPASSKLAHHIGCAVTPFLVCHAHLNWCAIHSIFGVYGTLVNCFIPPILLYKHVIRNKIHKIVVLYTVCPVYTPMTTRNQGYQYVFLKHIIVLVTTTHKNHITYFKCLVTVDTFNLVYTLMTAVIQGYQNVLLKHIYNSSNNSQIILHTLNALSLQIHSNDGYYSRLSICIPETYNSTCYNNS